MFLVPFFLGGGALPEILDPIYKIYTGSDHVAKFRGDRPRELGDYALKKEHHAHFIRPPVTTVHGRPNYIISINYKVRKHHSIQARKQLS